MTPEQARTLVQQIAATWPDGTWNTDAVRIWTDDLSDLDEGAAGTTLARLRRTWTPSGRQTHPSVREFYELYKTLDTRPPKERVACVLCDGSGWEPTTVTTETGTYSAVGPCRCQNGTERRDTFAAITKTNHTAA